mmetsp:Transcript_23392/g.55117  ORF Transcript_23392/g.55117 Transcript_23392/m.55117 type:complete len:1232 (+) Transcript_23392:118-3813(+)|eukprot:CAMPEP_0172388598 /NCGR_PEP_ID=MMETSP1061-20121228/5662_1 /TAXON_ID=37318 /ORGANISM="Pseudo-nitzschia pungens, Strain cf. pungens" /LENGTH=1231 /DNA_ID=CAMNT_0013118533 /DNA_START=88 /DNA_END=3783 /DNA_ORIENTATION=+
MRSFTIPKPLSGSKSKRSASVSRESSNKTLIPQEMGQGGFTSLDKETIMQPSSMISIVSSVRSTAPDPRDATSSTMRSTPDREILRRAGEYADSDDGSQEIDTFYNVEESPRAKNFASPPAKLTKSVTYSTKYVRDPNEYPQEQTNNSSLSVVNLPPAMPSSGNFQTKEEPVAAVIDAKATLPPTPKHTVKSQVSDEFYRVEASPDVNRYASPHAKYTKSVTYSTRYARDPSEHHESEKELSVIDLPRSVNDLSQSIHPTVTKDDFYDVPMSPSVQRYESPVPKGSGSVTFSTKFIRDPNYDDEVALVDLPESTQAALKAPQPAATPSVRQKLNNSLQTVENSSPETKSTNEETGSPSYFSATSSSGGSFSLGGSSQESSQPASGRRFGRGSAFSPTDPDAKHINRLVDNISSGSSGNMDATMDSQFSLQSEGVSTEGDEYYDVQESPRASAVLAVSNPSMASSAYPPSHHADYNDSAHANDILGYGNNLNYSSDDLPSSISAKTGSSTLFFAKDSTSSSSGANYSGSLLYSSESGATIIDSTGTLSESNRMYFTALKGDGSKRPPERRKPKKSFVERNLIHHKQVGANQQQLQQQQQQQQQQQLQLQLQKYEQYQRYQQQGGPEFDADFPIDPDGQIPFEDNYSTHGESLAPTPDDENDLNSYEKLGNESLQGSTVDNNTGSSPTRSSTTPHTGEEEKEEEEAPGSSGEDETVEVELGEPEQPSSSDSSTAGPKHSPFPSVPLLICLVVSIVLALGGLVGGLTYYIWDKETLDPLRPPSTAPVPGAPPGSPDISNGMTPPSGAPELPSDEQLLTFFASVIGDSVFDKTTTGGKAANWMLNDDPSKTLVPRSFDGWIQRYLLVYTYYATTENRSTLWLSCNPSLESTGYRSEEDACQFTYPTELPGGKVIYDLVPSHRWLSGTDECQWGGVACGTTVIDPRTGNSRLAVTSIVLADQYLMGSIVTELTALPELEVLDLSHNALKGTLSDSFRSLQTLRLQYNKLSGTIPANFFDDVSVMKELNVGSNSMTGTIPDRVAFASQMTGLFLFENEFTGTIPILGQMPLINFQGHRNKFTGMMPFDYDFGGMWPATLTTWWAFDNQLTGAISENLGFLSSLEDFRVQENKLTGTIPESIQQLSRMFRFEVQSNSLRGAVPEGIGILPALRDVRLQNNALTGTVPTDLCFLTSMELLEADCLEIPDNAFELEPTPQIECYCCTTCCNPGAKECITY